MVCIAESPLNSVGIIIPEGMSSKIQTPCHPYLPVGTHSKMRPVLAPSKAATTLLLFKSQYDCLIRCRTGLVALAEHQCCTPARKCSDRTQAVGGSMPEELPVRAAQTGTRAVAAAVAEAAEGHVPDPVLQAVVPRSPVCACAGVSHPREALYR